MSISNNIFSQETKRAPSTTPKVIASKDMKSVKNRWENAVNTTSNVKKVNIKMSSSLIDVKNWCMKTVLATITRKKKWIFPIPRQSLFFSDPSNGHQI